MTNPFRKDPDRSRGARMVLLSDRDVEDATRLIKLLAESSEAEIVRMPSSADRPQALTRVALVEAARREFEGRRQRAKFLPEGMFGEPAWEILLLLYVEQQGTRLNIARLTGILGLPLTSVLRWLGYLQDRRLILREGHPTDQRSVFLKLTSVAMEALDTYFSDALTRRS